MDAWRHFVDRLGRPDRPRREGPVRLVCFDLDGVLTEQHSSWVTVHRHFGLDNEESLASFLRGEISDEEFIRHDVALWRRSQPEITLAEIERILAEGVTVANGAKETLAALRESRVECAIVSGGIEVAALATARALGIAHVSANRLLTDARGRLTGGGVVNTPLRDKGRPVRRFAQELGIPLGQVASVGNSSPDIAMFRSSGLGIAFRAADEFVTEAADVVVAGDDLRGILEPIFDVDKRA